MSLWWTWCLVLCCVWASVGRGEVLQVDASNYAGLLNASNWFIMFASTHCGACRAAQSDWDMLTRSTVREAVRVRCGAQPWCARVSCLGDKFASVEVDSNRAIAEVFGIRAVPSFFLVSDGHVAPYKGPSGWAEDWIRRSIPKNLGSGEWLVGTLENPVSWVWRPFLHLGVQIDRLSVVLARIGGLNDKQTMWAVSAVLVLAVALWTVLLYGFLRCCFPDKPLVAAAAAAAEKKAKKD